MELTQTSRHPAINIIIFLALFLAGLLISQFLILVALYPFLGDQVMKLGNIISNPIDYPEYKNVLLFVQGFTSFFSMLITPLIFMQYFYKGKLHFFKSAPNEIFFLSACLLVIVSMPANAWLAELNQQMQMPEFMKIFESWATGKEQELKVLTEYLTTFDSNGQFIFGLIVIALIPAIGEELMFRGIIQTNLQDWFKNKHYAIWVAAFIFSAIHMQFYGFLPRLLLGALFGYFYAWTGNMLVPMLGHFTNNAFTVFLIHMKNQNKVKIDLESTKDLPVSVIIGSALIFGVFLWFFKSQLDAQKNNTQSLPAMDDDL